MKHLGVARIKCSVVKHLGVARIKYSVMKHLGVARIDRVSGATFIKKNIIVLCCYY